MLSKSLSRAARSSSCIPSPVATPSRAPSIGALQRSVPTAGHQRRPSSSKASCPPGGSKGSEQPAGTAAAPSGQAEKRPAARLAKRKSSKEEAAEQVKARDEAFANLPAVPSTTHLRDIDVAMSSFFSLHRPISITTSFPSPSTTHSFNSIFEPQRSQTTKSNDVIYTLSNTVASLEGGAAPSSEEKDLRWEILQNSSSNSNAQTTHLDGPPPQSLEQLVRQFRPFNKPPAPVPFDEAAAAKKEARNQQARADLLLAKNVPKAAPRTFTTTLTIKETTSNTGKKTYTAHASPIMEQRRSVEPVESTKQEPVPSLRQPFLARLLARQNQHDEYVEERAEKEGGAMQLISVKRQRKLKMKKHKYKKLMRRTRNQRKREGRL